MDIYILKNDDGDGGYYCAQSEAPDMRWQRPAITEVRLVSIPDDIWALVLAGGLPVDEDRSNDSTWIEWWPEGSTTWTR